jgi:hypothetical protein
MSKPRAPWWDRLNGALIPYLGPPPLGPYDQPEPPAVAGRACPLCGRPMGEHEMNRGENRPTYMRCPD